MRGPWATDCFATNEFLFAFADVFRRDTTFGQIDVTYDEADDVPVDLLCRVYLCHDQHERRRPLRYDPLGLIYWSSEYDDEIIPSEESYLNTNDASLHSWRDESLTLGVVVFK